MRPGGTRANPGKKEVEKMKVWELCERYKDLEELYERIRRWYWANNVKIVTRCHGYSIGLAGDRWSCASIRVLPFDFIERLGLLDYLEDELSKELPKKPVRVKWLLEVLWKAAEEVKETEGFTLENTCYGTPSTCVEDYVTIYNVSSAVPIIRKYSRYTGETGRREYIEYEIPELPEDGIIAVNLFKDEAEKFIDPVGYYTRYYPELSLIPKEKLVEVLKKGGEVRVGKSVRITTGYSHTSIAYFKGYYEVWHGEVSEKTIEEWESDFGEGRTIEIEPVTPVAIVYYFAADEKGSNYEYKRIIYVLKKE